MILMVHIFCRVLAYLIVDQTALTLVLGVTVLTIPLALYMGILRIYTHQVVLEYLLIGIGFIFWVLYGGDCMLTNRFS